MSGCERTVRLTEPVEKISAGGRSVVVLIPISIAIARTCIRIPRQTIGKYVVRGVHRVDYKLSHGNCGSICMFDPEIVRRDESKGKACMFWIVESVGRSENHFRH